jgi:hypothetical protein
MAVLTAVISGRIVISRTFLWREREEEAGRVGLDHGAELEGGPCQGDSEPEVTRSSSNDCDDRLVL